MSFAQVRSQNRNVDRVQQLESRAIQLERLLAHLDQRVSQLEYDQSYSPHPPRGTTEVICLLIDTGHSRTFKGEGGGLIEAEYLARRSCGERVHPTFCNGSIRCDTY